MTMKATKRKLLKQILINYGYKNNSIKSLMCGRMKPSYEAMLTLQRKYKVPFTAWEDIKSYLQENDITKGTNNARQSS